MTLVFPDEKNLVDVSDIRQVPDHQEVFAHKTSDLSLIVEILDRVDKDDCNEALVYHFADVSDINEAKVQVTDKRSVKVDDIEHVTDAAVLSASQAAAKFNEKKAESATVLMALLRVSSKTADVLVTLNNPAGDTTLEKFAGIIQTFRIADMGIFAD
ncbi:hypothetical protein LPJ53_004827 [Coemansia erecta]|uniref:Mog1p/PsbP-like protein n=1 Tax=Coemansia erecta TaxID=147472 RepID=A0A9W7XY41_9FUNG|nr:hypothetical protein LPJ53_004827 [Coemansia erecta]